MKLDVVVLPGDGIGPEVTNEALRVLSAVGGRFGHELDLTEAAVGGRALEESGKPLPSRTLEACRSAGAVLLGAVGAPRYDSSPRELKPETGLLQLRKELGAFANLRPIVVHDALAESSPLRREVVTGCDLLMVRELLGGLYFGDPRGIESSSNGPYRAFNTMSYTVGEIERIARVAFRAAMKRRRRVTSVDKANVLEVSRLWRDVVTRVATDYPGVELEHALVDSFAMQLVTSPTQFDVVLTENLFGDILSDEAAVIAGSIGVLSSASLGGSAGLYEPVHGSAPDIAGKGIANPAGAILSVALMLRYSFDLDPEARAVERAVRGAIDRGLRTPDMRGGKKRVSTSEFGDAVCELVGAR